MDFKHSVLTNMYFKKGVVEAYKETLRLGKRAMIVTGKQSGRQSGALGDIENALKDLGIAFITQECIGNNPDVEQCKQLGSLAHKEGCDFIIGVGGGSPMDAAKAIAVFAVNDISTDRLFTYGYDNGILPIVAVPTTSGTGSEVTPWSILTVHEKQIKRSFGGPDTFPKVALLDPDYTNSLPYHLTFTTAMDAFTHAFESVIAKKATPYTDAINFDALSRFGKCMEPLEKGEIADLREELMLVSMLAGTAIANTGTTFLHAMGYPLTYFKGAQHGEANAIMMPAYLEELKEHRADRLNVALNALGWSYDALMDYLKRNFTPTFTATDEDIALWARQTSARDPMRTTGCPGSAEHLVTVYNKIFK